MKKFIMIILCIAMTSSTSFGEVSDQFVADCFDGFELIQTAKYKELKTIEREVLDMNILDKTGSFGSMFNGYIRRNSNTCEDVLNLGLENLQMVKNNLQIIKTSLSR